ncbi:MAG: hypothetical protein HYV95_00805 [Opitutae bacterium]|nr:hypothetical protein [Opitutae bacterium]
MKAISQILRTAVILSVFGSAFLVSAPAADKKADAAQPADLQIAVSVPPSWRPFLDDDIAENFAYRLSNAFKRQGYKGNIVYLARVEEPVTGVPLLTLNLIEWRIAHSGNAQCTFSTTLADAKGEHSLGLTSNSAIFWPQSSGRWTIHRAYEQADALENAADGALRDLYKRLAKDNLLPTPAAPTK